MRNTSDGARADAASVGRLRHGSATVTERSRRFDPRPWARIGVHAAWMVLLTLWVTVEVARFGFNPTDQGFILAASRRVLHGEIPHVDIFSPRPLGSALLHTVDFALPGPLFLVSDAVTVAEFVVAAAAVTALVIRRPIRRFGVVGAAAAAAVALIDLHTFPVSAWHTVDGILCTAFGWLLLDAGLRDRSGRSTRRADLTVRGGLLLVGFAALCKQSFAPAVLVALVMLLVHPRRRPRPARAVVVDVVVLLAPAILYAVVVAAAGGLGAAVGQLLGGQSVWGRTLLVSFWGALGDDGLTTGLFLVGAIAALGCAVTGHLARTRTATRRTADGPTSGDRPSLPGMFLAAVVTVCAVGLVWHGHLVRPAQSRPDWAAALFWLLACAAVAEIVTHRTWRLPTLLVLALGWMTSLSWGYDTPELLGGGLALTAVVAVWRGILPAPHRPALAARWTRRTPGHVQLAGAAAVALLLVGTAAPFLLSARSHDIYRDLPRARLSVDLGAVSPQLRGIRSDRNTLAYLQQIRQCVATHPARSVAVLPDNAAIYPALDLDNPLPADWLFPPELDPASQRKVIAAMQSLDHRGHYLVLFQTVAADSLYRHAPPTSPGPALFEYGGQYATDPPLNATLRAQLHGEQVACGSFVAVWSR